MSDEHYMAELKPFAALFLDLVAWDSELLSPLLRDLASLNRLVSTRGLPIIMIDLPDAGKVVDHALSSGWLNLSLLPKVFGRRKWDEEFLFECLFKKVFDDDGRTHTDLDPNSVFFLRQVLYLAKKVRKECSKTALLSEVEAFRKIETECRIPTLRWDLDTLFPYWGANDHQQSLSFVDGYRDFPDWFSEREVIPKKLLKLLSSVSDIIISEMPEFDWRELTPRHGPGAVADAKRGTDKYLFPTYPRKLELTFPAAYFTQSREDMYHEVDRTYGDPPAHLQDHDDLGDSDGCPSKSENEPPARLLAVPKTLKAPRLIASEPIAHQFIQQGLMAWFRQHLPETLRTSINFLSQVPSREACLQASRDGKSATVDLSSASDRLSCWVVERVFRKNPELLRAMHACRTRTVKNCTGEGEAFTLLIRKFAAQGSAATFPVQSIVYTLVAMAALLFEDRLSPTKTNLRKAAGQIRVFGDDIVMPSRAVLSLVDLMAYLGLKVNMGKTHVSGHFRESCGLDAFEGYNVTPVYMRDLTLDTATLSLVSWVDISNNAYTSGLWRLADWMQNEIPAKYRKFIPVSQVDQSCITLRTYQAGSRFPVVRQSKTLHRWETLGYQVTTRTERRRRNSHQSLLQYFLEKPEPDVFGCFPKYQTGWTVGNRLLLRRRWVPCLGSMEVGN